MKEPHLKNLFLDQCKDAIWMVDHDFLLVYANKAYLQLIKEVAGVEKKINEAALIEELGEDNIERWKGYYTRALKGEYFEIEAHYFNPNLNKIQFSQTSFEPIFGDDNSIVTVACRSKDITRIVKHKSEASQLIDASLDVFCTVNTKGEFVYVSASAYQHWGYTSEELLGKLFIDFVLEADITKTNEILTAIYEGEKIKSFLNRYQKKDGSIAYNLWSSTWDNDSKLIYAVARDGKETVEQEEKLVRSEQRFKALVQAAYDLYAIVDEQGHYIYMSPSSTAIIGIPPEAFIGMDAFEFIHPEDMAQTRSSFKRVSSGTKVVMEPYRAKNQHGEWRWVETVLTNMLDNPAVKGIVINSRDITDEKNLRELNREVGQLAKIGSWEFNLVKDTLFWSDEVHQIYGTESNSFVPNVDTAINLYREDYRDLVRSSFEKCISTQEPYAIEAVIVNSNNEEVWVQTTAKAEVVDGVCTRIYGSFQDIDDRKQSEIRLQSLASNLPGVLFQYLVNPDGTDGIRNVSEGSEHIWGFSREAAVGNIQLVWDQIKAGGELKKVQKSISQSIEFKTNWTCRFKYMMPSGELRTYLGMGTPSFLTDGTIFFNSIILDVTQEAKNEELLKEVTNMARIGSWEMDLNNQNGDNIYWSPILREIVEVDDSYDPTLTGGIELHFGESKERIQKAIDLLIHEGIEFDEEVLLLTAKGNECWNRCIGKSEMVNGKRTKIYGSYQDIHEQKVAALALEKSLKALNDYKFSLDQSAIIATTDSKGVIISVNDNFCKISKYNEQELIGKTHSLIKSNHHPKEYFQNLWETISSGNVWRGELKNKAKDESFYWVDTTIVPFLDENNNPFQYLAIRFDITERKKAEEENRFKANLLSTVGQAAIATNLDGTVTYWNKAAENIYGWKAEEAIGNNIMQLTPTNSTIKEAEQIMEVLNKGQIWSGEFKAQKKDGTTFPIRTTNCPIYDEDNLLSGIIGISTDITKEVENKELLKQYTYELERSNEELEQFAFIASHDLQEPLRMISSFMNQLELKYGNQLDEKAHQYIHFATDGAKRMKEIILDLLEYSRANKPTEGKEDVDLNQVFTEFKLLRKKLISEKSAQITSSQLPTLYTYKAVVIQILHCLLDNAIKYSKADTPPIIEIIAEENKTEWKFSIKDNGIGIDPKFHDKIFVIFQRLHNRNEYDGTGIGLSIAKRHVELLKGQIWLDSKPGAGTVFYFTIPKT